MKHTSGQTASKPHRPRRPRSCWIFLLDPPIPHAIAKARLVDGGVWLRLRTSFDASGAPVTVIITPEFHGKAYHAVSTWLRSLGYAEADEVHVGHGFHDRFEHWRKVAA